MQPAGDLVRRARVPQPARRRRLDADRGQRALRRQRRLLRPRAVHRRPGALRAAGARQAALRHAAAAPQPAVERPPRRDGHRRRSWSPPGRRTCRSTWWPSGRTRKSIPSCSSSKPCRSTSRIDGEPGGEACEDQDPSRHRDRARRRQPGRLLPRPGDAGGPADRLRPPGEHRARRAGEREDHHAFKDGDGRVKRQAARFRVYVYDDQSPEGRELQIGDPIQGVGSSGKLVDIQWSCYLANKKASWYEFKQLEGEHGYAQDQPLRNLAVQGDARTALIIDPGPQRVNATDHRPAQFAAGKNPG